MVEEMVWKRFDNPNERIWKKIGKRPVTLDLYNKTW